jgi:hypothetical protein
MPGQSSFIDKAEKRINEYWENRNREMLVLRIDIEKYLKIDKDSLLAKKIAWFLTNTH